MGVILIAVQSAEETINFALTFVFQGEERLTLEKLERIEAAERSGTLGRLLKQLRERVELSPEFDVLLTQFLSDRNTFIHRILEVPGFDLSTREGRNAATAFLSRFFSETKEVLHVFWAFIRAWQEQLHEKGYGVPGIFDQPWPFTEDVERILPLVETLVRAKT